MLHVGVDEAGYGPLLGPLVVAVSALRTPDDTPPSRLRSHLKGVVVRGPTGPVRRGRPLPVPIDDSKVIHRRFGVQGLARGMGAFASAMDTPPPADLADLILRFSDRQPGEFERRPWYDPLEAEAVPRYPWTGPLAERFERRGLQALDLRVLPLDAPELNERVERWGNKARVLGLAAGLALVSLLDRHPGEDACVVFDRHGGRLDYARYLADLFPFARVTPRQASRGAAHYEVLLPDRRLDVRFETAADARHVGVAWASMAAKLTRELFMGRMNAWFLERDPTLRRTAGYVTDGRRFLEDVRSILTAEHVDPRELVRNR